LNEKNFIVRKYIKKNYVNMCFLFFIEYRSDSCEETRSYTCVLLPPSIYPSPICNWLKDQGKEIKYLPSLISGEACERNLLLAQMPKRRFSIFQWKNTSGPHKWNFQVSK
jgi:hypothetical protein